MQSKNVDESRDQVAILNRMTYRKVLKRLLLLYVDLSINKYGPIRLLDVFSEKKIIFRAIIHELTNKSFPNIQFYGN